MGKAFSSQMSLKFFIFFFAVRWGKLVRKENKDIDPSCLNGSSSNVVRILSGTVCIAIKLESLDHAADCVHAVVTKLNPSSDGCL